MENLIVMGTVFMLENRISAARGCLKRTGADLLIVSNLSNIRYLCGFTGSEGLLILSQNQGWFLTDSRYTSQAGEEVSGATVVEFANRLDSLAQVVLEEKAGKVAFEGGYTSYSSYREMGKKIPGVRFQAVDKELSDLRSVKDKDEGALLEKVARLASAALMETLAEVRPGARESDLAWSLECAMRKGGGEGKSFDFIVASGERGALPHGKASDKLLKKGELVTFDFGALYQGYCSDETVTVALGEPDPKGREIYEVVRCAQQLAIDAVRPGLPFKELDAVARDYIEAKGYGKYFGHGLGHGIGLDIHEPPTVSFRSAATIEEGMVFTIEPGIYLPGFGGVRIEDSVVVEGGGCRRITTVPKELMVL